MFNRNYKSYFLNVVVPAFLELTHDSYGSAKFAAMTKGMPLFHNKKGVLPKVRHVFNQFLEENPDIAEVMKENNFQVFAPKNICGGTLYPAVDCSDAEMMIAAGLHPLKLETNPEVFKKSREERLKLKKLRRVHGNSGLGSRVVKKVEERGTLFVQEKNPGHKDGFKSTCIYRDVKKSEILTVLDALHIRENLIHAKFDGVEV